MYTWAIALLAALVASTPVPDGDGGSGRLLTRAETTPWPLRITWRHGGPSGPGLDPRNILVTCGGGPIVGQQNGDKLSLSNIPWRYFCNEYWEILGTTFGSGFAPRRCIDSTLHPANGVQPHIWECHDGAWQQQWAYHADGRIELVGKGLCLDVTEGNATKPIQLWECVGNRNQQWNIGPTWPDS